jgi:hypothetical protein
MWIFCLRKEPSTGLESLVLHTLQAEALTLLVFTVRAGTPERCEGKGGKFSWKGTFELIYTKRCLQNIGSWTSPNHIFYLLDDRGMRGFSARRLCYSWRSMTAFLAFSEANFSKRIALTFLTIRYFAKAILLIDRAPLPPLPLLIKGNGGGCPSCPPPPVPASPSKRLA